jgi:uncharacterized protein (TIGR03083 family)
VNAASSRATPLGRPGAVEQGGPIDFVARFAAAAERFAESVADCDLRAPVPTCGTWSAYDVVVHLGNVHAWAATIVETGRPAAEQNDEPASAKARAVSRWYTGKAEDLYEVLRRCPADEPCWNFAFGSGTAAFWPRRQLHETTIHHLDLEQALGRETTIDPAVARDGVDEVLRVFLHRMHRRGRPARLEQPLAVTASDTGDSWVVAPQPRPGSTAMLPAQAVGTAAETVPSLPPSVEHRTSPVAHVQDRVEAPAGVLYRMLWKRLAPEDAGLRVSGDESRVRGFLESALVP